jgi:hypothetical protein
MTARSSKPTTPEDFPSQAPIVPSGDYSYTLEIVMNMQTTMGRLLEAVEGLKADSKEHRKELSDLGKEFHAARTVFRVLVAVFLAICGFIAWATISYITATHK